MQDGGGWRWKEVSCLDLFGKGCWDLLGTFGFFLGAYGAYAVIQEFRYVQVVGIRKGSGEMNQLSRSQMSSPHTLIREGRLYDMRIIARWVAI